MKETTIKWYTPQEKKPSNGYKLAVFLYKNCVTSITILDVYDGHFNCARNDFKSELHPDYWAEIPYFEVHTDCDYDSGTCHSVDFDNDVLKLVTEQEQEIERLKAENSALKDDLINTECNLQHITSEMDTIKQAKVEVLEELKKKGTRIYNDGLLCIDEEQINRLTRR